MKYYHKPAYLLRYKKEVIVVSKEMDRQLQNDILVLNLK